MNNPKVTVLMPVYNGALYLNKAIDSILCQSYSDFELLIIDDGSTDDTISIINQYSDSRIRLVSQANAGVSAALNRGLELSKGHYIARADSDDICRNDRLEKQMDFLLANPDHILVGSDADYMDKNGDFVFFYQNTGHTNIEIQQRYMQHCPFIHSTVIYEKDWVMKIGKYDNNAYLFEDYFLWIKLIKVGKVANLEEPLMQIRFNPESVTIDDKDCSPEYLQIKQKSLESGLLNDEEGRRLKINSLKISKEKKTYSYYMLLSKKYLWNNYQPQKVRMHLKMAIKILPLKPKTYLLFLFSFLPQSIIKFIYRRFK